MRRALTAAERTYVAEIFRDSVNLDRVTITRGSIAATFSATCIANTINLRARDFRGATMELSDTGWTTLIHEMGHIWQFQTRGIGYIPKSLFAQMLAFVTSGSRREAYDWLAAAKAGIPWEKWNPEQQAESIACFDRSWRRKATGKPDNRRNPGSLTDDEIVAVAARYMEIVWNGKPRRRAPPT